MAGTTSERLSADERKAIKERAAELKATQKREELEKALLEKIATLPEEEQKIATTLHEIVGRVAPQLTAKTWYGMPAWADAAGNVVVFFQEASKFGSRYSMIGFNDSAKLDEGSMWPTSWAVTRLTAADAKQVEELVRRAVPS